MFRARLTRPEAGNKYFIRTQSGGFNGAIAGKPTDKDNDVLANCVGYSNGRFGEVMGEGRIRFQMRNNAERFIELAKAHGLEIGQTPRLGAIAVWADGAVTVNGEDGVGHVANVERIENGNTIITSESAWNGKAFFVSRRTKGENGQWGASGKRRFLGFIYNPAVKEEAPAPQPTPAPTPTPQPAPAFDLLTAVKKTIRGDYGNGEARKKALGGNYAAVQNQVNLNIKNGTTRWDNVKIYS